MKKRILITGGASFIGSYLCERLLNDKTFRKRWTEEHLRKQEHFLCRDVIQTTRKVSDLGAEAIDNCLRNCSLDTIGGLKQHGDE